MSSQDTASCIITAIAATVILIIFYWVYIKSEK